MVKTKMAELNMEVHRTIVFRTSGFVSLHAFWGRVGEVNLRLIETKTRDDVKKGIASLK